MKKGEPDKLTHAQRQRKKERTKDVLLTMEPLSKLFGPPMFMPNFAL